MDQPKNRPGDTVTFIHLPGDSIGDVLSRAARREGVQVVCRYLKAVTPVQLRRMMPEGTEVPDFVDGDGQRLAAWIESGATDARLDRILSASASSSVPPEALSLPEGVYDPHRHPPERRPVALRLYAILDLPDPDIGEPFVDLGVDLSTNPIGRSSVLISVPVPGADLLACSKTIARVLSSWPSLQQAEVRNVAVTKEAAAEVAPWWPFGVEAEQDSGLIDRADLRRGVLRVVQEVHHRVGNEAARTFPKGFTLDWSSAEPAQVSKLWEELKPYVTICTAVGVTVGVRL